jgi:predicted kinase
MERRSGSVALDTGQITAVRMSDSRRLVYVSGAPGSGKTSLAVPLADELGYVLVSKDRIKEALHDALGAAEPDRAWSRRLGGASMELLWVLAAGAPAVVIEANFRPYSQHERAKLSGLAAQPVEVHCVCPPELALQRYNARVRHPVHTLTTIQQEVMAEFDRPVGIGTLVTVDTTFTVDVKAVAAAVRNCHEWNSRPNNRVPRQATQPGAAPDQPPA